MDLKRRNRKNEVPEILPEMFGKLPPQAIEFEEAVLGAIIIEMSSLRVVSAILRPEHFYKESHNMIFQAIMELYQAHETIDMLTVTLKLRKKGQLELIGGPVVISTLTNKVSSTANIEVHSRVIVQKFMQRELIRSASGFMNQAYSEEIDIFNLLATAARTISDIQALNVNKQAAKVSELTKPMLDDIDKRLKDDGYKPGVTTGLRSIDAKMAYRNGNLWYIAARPGVGKTGFMITGAIMAALSGVPVGIFSLEMTKEELMFRIAAQISSVDVEHLMNQKPEESELIQLHENLGRIENLPIYIDDTPALSIMEMRSKTSIMKEKFGIGIVFVDYVQLMTDGSSTSGNFKNREQEISTISRGLKQVAKECDVPVVSLSQLSRDVEKRGDKRPVLSDLRESGSLEQDADGVVFIYRPEYHHEHRDKEGNSTAGSAEIIIAKHRNGSIAARKVRFIAHTTRFVDLDRNLPHPDNRIEPQSNDDSPF